MVVRAWLVAALVALGCRGGRHASTEEQPQANGGSNHGSAAAMGSRDELLAALRAYEAELRVAGARPDTALRWHIDQIEHATTETSTTALQRAGAFMRGYRAYLEIDGIRMPDELRTSFETMCNAGDLPACNTYAAFIMMVDIGDKELPRAIAYMKRACDGGYLGGCFGWGTHIFDTDREAGEALLIRACEGGIGSACGWLAAGLGQSQEVQVRAFGYNKRGCELDDAWVCETLGTFYRNGWGTKEDLELAKAAYQRGCDLHHGYSCRQLADQLEKAGGNREQIQALHVRSCELDWAELYCKGLIQRPPRR